MKLIANARVLRPLTFETEHLDVLIEGDRIKDLVPRGSVNRCPW